MVFHNNPLLFHGFDEPVLVALKFEKNSTELSFVSEVNAYPDCVLNGLLSQGLGNHLESHESAGKELAIRTFIKEK